MAEFLECGRGDLDELTFYGVGGSARKFAVALGRIKRCPKLVKNTCDKDACKVCQRLKKLGKLDKIEEIKSGKIPCSNNVDLNKFLAK